MLDNLSPSAHAVVPAYLNPEAEYVWADVADADATARAVAGADAVSHQAARVGLGVDFHDVTAYVQDNDTATAVLLRCLYECRWQGRLVLASSMVVYGEGAYECAEHGRVNPRPGGRTTSRLGVSTPAALAVVSRCARWTSTRIHHSTPRSVYAATKLQQEHLCEALVRETGTTLCASALSQRLRSAHAP